MSDCATPETAAHQAPLSLGFSRQDHWSGLPFPSPKFSPISPDTKHHRLGAFERLSSICDVAFWFYPLVFESQFSPFSQVIFHLSICFPNSKISYGCFISIIFALIGLCVFVLYFKSSFTFVKVILSPLTRSPCCLLLSNHCTFFSPQLRCHFSREVFNTELCFHSFLYSPIQFFPHLLGIA